MYQSETKVRVRYGETDQMGYVYYGVYAQYYEVARTEMIRDLGFSYRKFEEDGIMLPVTEMKIKYLRPARYDDLLTIVTRLEKIPAARITFHYDVFNEQKEKLNEGEVTLVFSNAETRRPCRPPVDLTKVLEKHFS